MRTEYLDFERVLDALIESRFFLKGREIMTRKPTHGSCCTCQTCGFYHDECACQSNELLLRLRENVVLVPGGDKVIRYDRLLELLVAFEFTDAEDLFRALEVANT